MVLTMEQSIERQLMEMKDMLLFWQNKQEGTKDQKLIEKCGREIFKEKYRISQVTDALSNYRSNM